MKKYNISDEFKIHSKLNAPFDKKFFPMAEYVLSYNSHELESDEDVEIKTEIIVVDSEEAKLYVYIPKKYETDKVLLFIHGGGFAYKGYYKHYRMCRRAAIDGGCKVVYIDYRLMPKYMYPVAPKDCFCAYKWIIDNSKELGIDVEKIIVGGDSAGGCLSCDVTFMAHEEGIILPRLLLLLYPVLDKRMNTKSMHDFFDAPVWNRESTEKMWEYYLGDQEYISPGERENLEWFPNTYIETAEFDCLRDEGILFAKKLESYNVDVTLNETKGTIHGFDIKSCPTTEEAVSSRLKMIKAIK